MSGHRIPLRPEWAGGGTTYSLVRASGACGFLTRNQNPETGLIEWRAVSWGPHQPAEDATVTFHGQDFHDARMRAEEAVGLTPAPAPARRASR